VFHSISFWFKAVGVDNLFIVWIRLNISSVQNLFLVARSLTSQLRSSFERFCCLYLQCLVVIVQFQIDILDLSLKSLDLFIVPPLGILDIYDSVIILSIQQRVDAVQTIW
jgi:hypothetical protein